MVTSRKHPHLWISELSRSLIYQAPLHGEEFRTNVERWLHLYQYLKVGLKRAKARDKLLYEKLGKKVRYFGIRVHLVHLENSAPQRNLH